MEKLSVCIITFNEEKNIKRCLESVKDIADEIVVVDSFSTDATERICNEYNVKFHKQIFLGHIEQKNLAISLCQHDFVLSLDADEALSDELKKSIRAVKNKFEFDAYEMNRLSNYCGKWIYHSGWYPDKKIRLINKSKGKFGGQNPHDKILLIENSSLKHLQGDILHYTYYTVEEHYKQADKFSTIAATELFKKQIQTNTIHIAIKTAAKFIRNYFIMLGFLDGAAGFTICRIAAYETYLKYSKLKALNRTNKR